MGELGVMHVYLLVVIGAALFVAGKALWKGFRGRR